MGVYLSPEAGGEALKEFRRNGDPRIKEYVSGVDQTGATTHVISLRALQRCEPLDNDLAHS